MASALTNWTILNNWLRSANELQCKKMLQAEREGKRRVIYLLRIYGRYNRLRAARERRELVTAETMKRDYQRGNWSS